MLCIERIFSLFLLEPLYLFTSLTSVDLVKQLGFMVLAGLIKEVPMSVSGLPAHL